MESYTTTTFKLSADDTLVVVVHADSVSLSLPGYLCADGRGFALRFLPEHRTLVNELAAAVAHLRADHTPAAPPHKERHP